MSEASRQSMTPEVVVHHLEQAKLVLGVAKDVSKAVQLRSAPGAAAYAGVGYLKTLGEAVSQPLLIDCDDDAGLVMAALRHGCQCLTFSGPSELQQRLIDIAEQQGAVLYGPATPTPPHLILLPDDDEKIVRQWLNQQATN